jgi:hypothetical protein
MRADLTSFTDAGMHALYDPSIAVPREEKVLDAVATGDLFVIDTASDGEIHLCVYVGEPLPEKFQPRIERTTCDALLRVPSGQLWASGVEYVGYPEDGTATTMTVAPGTYLADVYELDVSWDGEIVPVLKRELGPSYPREALFGPLGSFSIFLGLAGIAVGALTGVWLVLGAGLGVGLLGLSMIKFGVPKGDYEQRKREIAMRFPSLVVVLRPWDGDPGKHRGTILHTAD